MKLRYTVLKLLKSVLENMINYVYDKIWLYHEGQGGEEETNDQSDIRSVAHHQPQPTTEGDGIRLVPSTFYKEKSQILMRYGVFVVKQMTAFFSLSHELAPFLSFTPKNRTVAQRT